MKELAYFAIIRLGGLEGGCKCTMGFVVVITKPYQAHTECVPSGVGQVISIKKKSKFKMDSVQSETCGKSNEAYMCIFSCFFAGL